MRDELMALLELKSVMRTGWVRAGVEQPESVAAHSWGMAVLALRLCPPELDIQTVLTYCLIHDLPEIIVGDLTPHDDRSTKAADEHAAMKKLAPQWLEAFETYERQDTPEAKFVHQLDRLDMGLQAHIYQNSSVLNLNEFIKSAKSVVSDPSLNQLL
ncbi:MAG: HD domain-containing protein [Euryarchaeota archaeon]|nr:HD domain-containing protein [Euryarchaeota archaeon]MBT5454149.1 HD domain-containing protein [Euryarchaeota archaeon]